MRGIARAGEEGVLGSWEWGFKCYFFSFFFKENQRKEGIKEQRTNERRMLGRCYRSIIAYRSERKK